MNLKRTLFYIFYLLFCFSRYSKAQVLELTHTDSIRITSLQNQYKDFLNNNNVIEASKKINEIGSIFWNYNQYVKALSFYEKSLELSRNIGYEEGVIIAHNNLGMLYADVNDYDKALNNFSQTLITARKLNKEPVIIISSLKNRAVVYNNIKKYNLAINDIQEALSLAREVGNQTEIASAYAMLSETYEKMGNVDESIKYFTLYKSFHDAEQKTKVAKLDNDLKEESLKKQLAEAEAKTKELELKQNEIKLKESKELLIVKNDAFKKLYQNYTKSELINRLQLQENKELENINLLKLRDIIEKQRLYTIISYILLMILLLMVLTLVWTYKKS